MSVRCVVVKEDHKQKSQCVAEDYASERQGIERGRRKLRVGAHCGGSREKIERNMWRNTRARDRT